MFFVLFHDLHTLTLTSAPWSRLGGLLCDASFILIEGANRLEENYLNKCCAIEKRANLK